MRWLAALALVACGPLPPERTHREPAEVVSAILEPSALVPPAGERPADRRILRIRIWVDEVYRRRPTWRKSVAELVAGANAYLEPSFGVTLEAEVVEWDVGGAPALPSLLRALLLRDRGADVDHVVGLTSGAPIRAQAHELIGLAAAPGKHFVVRVAGLGEELRYLRLERAGLDRAQRRALFERRRDHQDLAVFLHEWAHNYGALHGCERTSVMAASYHPRNATFDPASVRLIELSLRARAGLSGAAPALLEHISNAEACWTTVDRERVVRAFGRLRLSPSPSPPSDAGSPPG